MSTDGHVEAVVLGAGVLGLAVAAELTARRRRTAILDMAPLGHPGGSSHGHARMRVAAAYPDGGYLERGRRADDRWAALERETGERLRIVTGCLSWGADQNRLARELDAGRERWQELSASAARDRFPMLALPAGTRAIFQPDASTLRADRVLGALARLVVRRGAELHHDVRVEGIVADGTGVRIRAGRREWRAEVAIACLGAANAAFCAAHGIDLPVSASTQTVSYFDWDGPCFPGLIQYGAPDPYACWCPVDGLKAAEHAPGPLAAGASAAPDPAAAERTRAWVAERFGAAVAGRRRRLETCTYVSTVDERFLIQRDGALVAASACSGHGFQYAPDTAMRIAELALSP